MYNLGDHVVVRIVDIYQVAIVTNIHSRKNTIVGYDVRSEKGSGYCIVSVDKPKDTYSINSTLTAVWKQNTDTPTNLAFNRHIVHTRANYGEIIRKKLEVDRHYEKYNDFSCPVIGDRSW